MYNISRSFNISDSWTQDLAYPKPKLDLKTPSLAPKLAVKGLPFLHNQELLSGINFSDSSCGSCSRDMTMRFAIFTYFVAALLPATRTS